MLSTVAGLIFCATSRSAHQNLLSMSGESSPSSLPAMLALAVTKALMSVSSISIPRYFHSFH
jgi:hypothetical protein